MKELRRGYTTGTCAAIASRAALIMIFEQRLIESEEVLTPKGVRVRTRIEDPYFKKEEAGCGVKKDAGDDPDVTDGIVIYSRVILKSKGKITIDGGEGIGRITRAGLDRSIGEAAINTVPRQMIEGQVRELFEFYGYEGGADILISAPGGEEIAKKTFNPRLGIVGGISVLGSSGIVEPYSLQALVDSIKAEINVKFAEDGEILLLVPGNYGSDFLRDNFNLSIESGVKCSNFLGEAIDHAGGLGFRRILLVGHVGKLIKLSGGVMNTHSKMADCRMELLALFTALEGGDRLLAERVLGCISTEEALELIDGAGLKERVMQRVLERALFYMRERAGEGTEIGLIMFSKSQGLLAKSENADGFIEGLHNRNRSGQQGGTDA